LDIIEDRLAGPYQVFKANEQRNTLRRDRTQEQERLNIGKMEKRKPPLLTMFTLRPAKTTRLPVAPAGGVAAIGGVRGVVNF